jgi:hypothetical protein
VPASFACWILWIGSSAAVVPLTYVSWIETTNTCCPQNPFLFLACAINIALALCYGHQIFGSGSGWRAGLWAASAIFYLLPLALVLLGGRSGLESYLSAYKGFTQWFTMRRHLEFALQLYLLIWMPIGGLLSLGVLVYAAARKELGLPMYSSENLKPRKKWPYHWIAPVFALLVGSEKAHHNIWRTDLVTLEHQTAYDLIRRIQLHDAMYPQVRVTNLAQVFATDLMKYPTYLHEKFLKYGRHAGFQTSIHERYVFAEAGLTIPYVRGDVVLLNSMPYPNYDGELERMVISRTGPGYDGYHANPLAERLVQQMFAEAGRTLPVPNFKSSMRNPETPFFVHLAESLGFGAEWAVELGLLVTGLFLFGMWRIAKYWTARVQHL